MDEQNYGIWPGWNPGRRNDVVRVNTVVSYDEVKKDRIPPNSMKSYFRTDEDIVYIKTTDQNGNAQDRGFYMREFSIDEEEALNSAVTEGRLRDAMNDMQKNIANMFQQLKEDLANGQQPVRTENHSASNKSGGQSNKDRRECT